MLGHEGYDIGTATGQACNSLIDSNLQLLIAYDMINAPISHDTMSLWRLEVCESTRQYLCNSVNVAFHP